MWVGVRGELETSLVVLNLPLPSIPSRDNAIPINIQYTTLHSCISPLVFTGELLKVLCQEFPDLLLVGVGMRGNEGIDMTDPLKDEDLFRPCRNLVHLYGM